VRHESECEEAQLANPACLLASIRIQAPFELPLVSGNPRLILEQDGVPGAAFPLQLVVANAHVLASCDANWDTKPDCVCSRTVHRADGRPADRDNPLSEAAT
jgi:hypothetical protein